MGTDIEVDGIGWWVDDVAMLNAVGIRNEAFVTTAEGYSASADLGRLGTIVFEENIPEPIVLQSITATGQQKHIALEWVTSAESNNAGFELQRKTGKTTYEAIAWFDSKGESRTNIKYKHRDRDVVAATVYTYRLRQVDIQGNERFSEEVSATLAGDAATAARSGNSAAPAGFNLYPNPTQGSLTISYTKQADEPLLIQVYNLQGKTLYLQQLVSGQESGQLKIDLPGVPNGLYILKVSSSAGSFARKFEMFR